MRKPTSSLVIATAQNSERCDTTLNGYALERITPADVAVWDGDEELAVTQLIRVQNAIARALPPLDPERSGAAYRETTFQRLRADAFCMWGTSPDLLSVDDEGITDWIERVHQVDLERMLYTAVGLIGDDPLDYHDLSEATAQACPGATAASLLLGAVPIAAACGRDDSHVMAALRAIPFEQLFTDPHESVRMCALELLAEE